MSSIQNQVSLNSSGPEISRRSAGLTAGIGYIILFILAIFANFMVREGLIVPGDAASTAANISASEGLFRTGMVSFLVIFLLDVPIAWALLIVFRTVHRDLALLAAWFRILYTVFLGVALIFFFQALQYLGGQDYLSVFTAEQLNAGALAALDSFNSAWLIGLTAFGVHLIFTGILILRSGVIVRVLGWVLMAAGAAYIFDTLMHSLLSDYADYAGVFTAIVAVPSILAEGWFGIWLIAAGGKEKSR